MMPKEKSKSLGTLAPHRAEWQAFQNRVGTFYPLGPDRVNDLNMSQQVNTQQRHQVGREDHQDQWLLEE